ncbi:MAG: protein kinase [Myxococcota bacterium]
MATGKMTMQQLLGHLDLATVATDHASDATLRPTVAPRFRADGSAPRATAPQKKLPPPAEGDRSSEEVRILGPLAEGGMGQLFLAEQGGLRRHVAIKTLKDEFLEPAFAQRLLREARILGLVEHPNVVPLHALHTDERNAPALVMKRIEGVPWRVLLRDDHHPAFPADARDRLAWHLQVFMRVCDAVHYAHSRGILHLDLKPDNVMIGSFREVYLVDWGVAVAIHPDHRGWLPMADEIREILGTPAYLAPEMVDVARQTLDVRTDVYLLGATLYEVLTGAPPHRGASLQELLYAAYEAERPTLPPSVPRELARIVQRAMEPDRNARFEDVEALRSAVAAFLDHRNALEMARLARSALTDLRARLAEEPAGPPLIRNTATAAKIHRLFARARFGFAEALRQWPESTNAASGQRATLLTMCRYHLDRGEAASAEGLLDELEDYPEPRALRAEAAAQRRSAADLERLKHEESARLGEGARARLLLFVGGLVALASSVAWIGEQTGIYEWRGWHGVVFGVVLLLAGAAAAFATRRSLFANRRSRNIGAALAATGVLTVVLRVVAIDLGISGTKSLVLEMVMLSAGAILSGTLADRRMLPSAPCFLLAVVGILQMPTHALAIVAAAALSGTGVVAYRWLKDDRSGTAS